MTDMLEKELRDIASRQHEPGAREALKPFLSIFLPFAYRCVDERTLRILCNLSGLSTAELELRAKRGIPPADVNEWKTYGNHFLLHLYHTLGSLPYTQQIPNPPLSSVAQSSDGVRTLLDLCVSYSDWARAYLNQDVVLWGGLDGQIAARRYSSTKPELLFTRKVSPAPIRDVALRAGTGDAYVLDDHGQMIHSDAANKLTLFNVDSFAQRTSLMSNGVQLLTASTKHGVGLFDVKFAPRLLSKWSTVGVSTVSALTWENFTFLAGNHTGVRVYDTRDPRPGPWYVGPQVDPSEVCARDPRDPHNLERNILPELIAAGCTEATYIWDVRRSGEALFKLKTPGDYPLGPPPCAGLLLRPHVVSVARGDSVFSYSLLDGALLVCTRTVGHRILAINRYEPPVANSSRLGQRSLMAVVTVRRPLISDCESWNIY
jgi:hypothetical protein